MEDDEIRFEDLLGDDPPSGSPPASLADVLANGFPPDGNLADLAAIARLKSADPRFALVQHRYRNLLEMQERALLREPGSELPAPTRWPSRS